MDPTLPRIQNINCQMWCSSNVSSEEKEPVKNDILYLNMCANMKLFIFALIAIQFVCLLNYNVIKIIYYTI